MGLKLEDVVRCSLWDGQQVNTRIGWAHVAAFGDELRRLLAERGMSLRALARGARCDPGYLSRVVNGHKPVTPHLAAILDDTLCAGGRLRTAAAVPALAGRRGDDGNGWLARRAVTLGDVEAIREVTRTFRGLDNKFGGAHAHVLAAGYLDSSVVPMLRAGTYREDVGQQLFGAAAQLAHLVAWTAYDIDNHRRARLYFTRALELATAAGDHAFGGEILAARSHHGIHLGAPAKAAELARACQHIAKKAAIPALLAEACALEANSHALLGDAKACLASLRESERAFHDADPKGVPDWLRYLDEGYLAARFAHSLRDLGQWDEARRYSLQAVRMSENMARTRAFNTAVLATTYVETDIDQACGVGMEVLNMAAKLQSARVIRYLEDFQRRLRKRHGNEPAVKQFSEHAIEVLGAN